MLRAAYAHLRELVQHTQNGLLVQADRHSRVQALGGEHILVDGLGATHRLSDGDEEVVRLQPKQSEATASMRVSVSVSTQGQAAAPIDTTCMQGC